ncbi:MAG: DUF362 domain-containing protein [Lachnospiraceae bacterium]|nr:DUF362 domain-containing protein [Lachnospiraceae bacterium]
MKDIYIHKLSHMGYPDKPYHPEAIYPELAQLGYKPEIQGENEVFSGIREMLFEMGLDKEKYGTPEWNPLKDFIRPGEKAVLKPNLVFHEHPKGPREMESMVTNGAVLRPIIDYILIAAKGEVEITIADAPIQGADFQKTCALAGITALQEFYKSRGIRIRIADMRMVRSLPNEMDILEKRIYQRDASHYRRVDLREKSELIDVIDKVRRFEITDYGIGSVRKHHSREKNEYFIPREVLEADLFVNLPKIKTHRKAGLTCAMKNLVGINGDKTCLAHHTRGTRESGGDEFSQKSVKLWLKVRVWTFLKTNWLGIKAASLIKRFFQRFIWKGKSMKEYNMEHAPTAFFEGSWHGNDTIWRCVKDLNKIVLYADKQGRMQEKKQRRYLCIADGVLAGEGEGPMEQTTKPLGVILAGTNPVYADYAVSRLMCYDYRCIPSIARGFENRWWPLADKQAEQVEIAGNRPLEEIRDYFVPSFGWREKLTPYVGEGRGME